MTDYPKYEPEPDDMPTTLSEREEAYADEQIADDIEARHAESKRQFIKEIEELREQADFEGNLTAIRHQLERIEIKREITNDLIDVLVDIARK